MNMIDFENAIRALLLLRLRMDEWDAARLIGKHALDMELWFKEGFAPIDAVSKMIGRELPEGFDVAGHFQQQQR
jgi:hypothetical protein